jgi:hypothetical protein
VPERTGSAVLTPVAGLISSKDLSLVLSLTQGP